MRKMLFLFLAFWGLCSGQALAGAGGSGEDAVAPVGTGALSGRVALERAEGVLLEVTELDLDGEAQARLGATLGLPGDKLKGLRVLAVHDPEKHPMLKRAEKTAFFLLLFANSTNDNIVNFEIAGENLRKNFTNPVGRAVQGYRIDKNPFYINYVAHPIDWFLMGTYLKAAGAGDKEAIVMSQLANIAWEYVLEGSYIEPSGKDLITNTVCSLAGIYLYNKGLTRPVGTFVRKAEAFGKRHNIELKPDFSYNRNSRGAVIASRIIIRR